MTTVPLLRGQKYLARVAGATLIVTLASFATNYLFAAAPPVHYQHAGVMPPGAIGQEQLRRGGPLPGYFQPVEITAPRGAMISTVADGQFMPPERDRVAGGMLIGAVYRLRVTGVPLHEDAEVFPTIEVIDRLYPPCGKAQLFPIPVVLTAEELEMAIEGKFVTRVIYVENPAAATPVSTPDGEQEYFEAGVGDDPLAVADKLGRPVAILRIGGRTPDVGGPDGGFFFGSPPLLRYRPMPLPANSDRALRMMAPTAKATTRKPPIVRPVTARAPVWRGQDTR